jgi:RNA polymerase sigma-70 factor (ECF subfamily)
MLDHVSLRMVSTDREQALKSACDKTGCHPYFCEMDQVTKQRILGGDLDAYGDVVREYQGMLIGYALRRLGDWTQAEEVVQLTFIRAYQRLEEFRPEEEFGVWLCVTCKYMIMTELEKRRREARNKQNYRNSLEVEIGESLTEGIEKDHGLDHIAALRGCLGRIQSEAASVIELRYFEKQSCKEIAAAKDRSITWVTSTLSRARQALRQCLEKRSDMEVVS